MPGFNEITADNAAQLCSIYFNSPIPPLSMNVATECAAKHRDRYPGYFKGFYIDRTAIESILKQGNFIDGIRIYLGAQDTTTGEEKLVIVLGTDQEHNDYGIPLSITEVPTVNPIIAQGRPCPDECGISNILNSNV